MTGGAEVALRRPVAGDAAALADLVNELSLHEGDPTGHFTPDRALADVIAPGAPVSALVAEAGGALVGYAFWHFAYESAWAARGGFLCDLYVREAARGRGVGDALLRAVAREVREGGGVYLWWTTYQKNKTARAFYLARGVEETGIAIFAAIEDGFEALVEGR